MPPATPGLVTVTGTVAGVAIADAGIAAVSWVALTNVVVCAWPFQFTTAVAAKFVPLTVKVKFDPPEMALLGISWAIDGVVPGCAGVLECVPYPHPMDKAVNSSKQMTLIFMLVSPRLREASGETRLRKGRP